MGPNQAATPHDAPPRPVPPSTPSAPAAPAPAVETRRPSRHFWLGLIPGMVALVIMLVFIFQNLGKTTVRFLGFSGGAPLGLALVAAALLGGVIVFGLGSVRIVQLRKLARAGGRRP